MDIYIYRNTFLTPQSHFLPGPVDGPRPQGGGSGPHSAGGPPRKGNPAKAPSGKPHAQMSPGERLHSNGRATRRRAPEGKGERAPM